MSIHFAPSTGCNLGCTYSAVPGTRVLTADLRWVPIEEIDLGDEVVAFDRPEQTEKNKQSKLRVSRVSATWKYEEDAVRIVTDRGEATVGATHPFLSKFHGFRDAQDFETGQKIRHVLTPVDYDENDAYRIGYVHGAFAGDGSIFKNDTTHSATIRCQDRDVVNAVHDYAPDEYGLKLKKKTTTGLYEVRTTKWDEVDNIGLTYPANRDKFTDEDYVRGWLAGMFDTDGHFDGNTVKFLQTKKEQRELLQIALDNLGYDYEVEEKGVRVRGQGSRFRILAEIRPKVSRKVRNYEGRGWRGTATVEKVEHVGKRVFHDITVDTYHTLILEGFCSHNCYEEPDREMRKAAIRHEYDLDKVFARLEDWKSRYPNTTPGLHGGEPMLLPDEDLEKVLRWIHENYDGNGGHIQTNGTLIKDHHIEMFRKYNTSVGISCDGPPSLNTERQARLASEDATDAMSAITGRAITKLRAAGVNIGIIVVLHKTNAGTDERLETLLSWIDNLNRMGCYGHFNPAIPYEDIQEDISLSPERLKEVYVRTWDWLMEPGNPHRQWDPMRQALDNLLGLQLGNCVNNRCDVFNAGAAKIIMGDGESTGCGKTWSAVGDGVPFLQGPSSGNEYNDSEERYEMLMQTPGWVTEGEPDLGGCKGCKYWTVCQGGCPSAAVDYDFRNRSRWCEAVYALYERAEEQTRQLMPAVRLTTDLPWDADTSEMARTARLGDVLKPFANASPEAYRPSVGKRTQHPHGEVHEIFEQPGKDGRAPEWANFDEKVEYYVEEYGEENIEADPEAGTIHADVSNTDGSGWVRVDSDEDEAETECASDPTEETNVD